MWSPEQIAEHISSDPNVCFGKPVIRGTRIWVSLILDLLASGTTEDEIIVEYPQLSRDSIRAALAYGALTAHERVIPAAEK